jgi:hypothetical protein
MERKAPCWRRLSFLQITNADVTEHAACFQPLGCLPLKDAACQWDKSLLFARKIGKTCPVCLQRFAVDSLAAGSGQRVQL